MAKKEKTKQYISNALSDLTENIEKNSKMQQGTLKHIAVTDQDISVISTGLQTLDALLGVGGLPRKTVVEIFGEPGGGKSFIAQSVLAQATLQYGWCCYVDVEGGLNLERARNLGVVTNRLTYQDQFDTGEQALQMICDLLYTPNFYKKYGIPFPRYYDVIVLDSVAALGAKKDLVADQIGELLDGDSKEGSKIQPAARARMISNFSPKILSAMSKSSGLWKEDMSGIFRNDNTFYSFDPDDKEIPETLIKDIEKVVKERNEIKGDIKKEEHQKIYLAIRRREIIEESFSKLSEIADEQIAQDIIGAVEKIKIKEFYDIMHNVAENISDEDNTIFVNYHKKLEKILNSLNNGAKITPPVSQGIKDFEKAMRNGHIYEILNGDTGFFRVVHYNPGPILIIINQIRTGNIGGYGQATEERPGGFAFKHAAGTAIKVRALSKSQGAVFSEDGKTRIGHKSTVTIEKSRFATPFDKCEIIIPFVKDAINPFSEFMRMCEEQDIWKFSRKFYNLPPDGSIIKTKDEITWKTELYAHGLKYIQEQLNYSDEQMEDIYASLSEELSQSFSKEEDDDEVTIEDDVFEL